MRRNRKSTVVNCGRLCLDFSVGTEEDKADLYPEQQVGLDGYEGEVTLTSDGMKFTGGNQSMTVNDTVRDRRRRDVGGAFYMEPGR